MSRLFLLLYNVYAWTVLGLFLLLALLGLTLLPKLPWRRSFGAWTVRCSFALMGIRLKVHGRKNIPDQQLIAIANHCSFMDGPLVNAILPPRFAFVVKREITDSALPGWLMQRSDAVLVDRFDSRNSARDGGSLIRRAVAGESIVIFPEGGYGRPEKLKPFKAGAFVAARRAQCALLPVAIQGTANVLLPNQWLIKPGRIEIFIGDAITWQGDDKANDQSIREAAIAQIEGYLGLNAKT